MEDSKEHLVFTSAELFGFLAFTCIHLFAMSLLISPEVICGDALGGYYQTFGSVYMLFITVASFAAAFLYKLPSGRLQNAFGLSIPIALCAVAVLLIAASRYLYLDSVLMVGAAYALLATANALILIRAGVFFASLEKKKAFCLTAVACIIAGVAVLALQELPSVVYFSSCLLLPFASTILLAFAPKAELNSDSLYAKKAHTPVELLSSYLDGSRISPFFIIMLLFCIAFGFAGHAGFAYSTTSAFPYGVIVICAGVILLAFVLATKSTGDLFVLQWGLLAVLIVSLLFPTINESDSFLMVSGYVLLAICFNCYDITNWSSLYEASQEFNPIYVYGMGRGIFAAGVTLGRLIHQGLMSFFGNEASFYVITVITLVTLFFVAFIVSNMPLFRKREEPAAIAPSESEEQLEATLLDAGADADVRSESPFELKCDEIAETAGLTAREKEVLCMLARGRNVEFIQKMLVVSRSTARTHVYHVYQKLNVHSKQEIIDLVWGSSEKGQDS